MMKIDIPLTPEQEARMRADNARMRAFVDRVALGNSPLADVARSIKAKMEPVVSEDVLICREIMENIYAAMKLHHISGRTARGEEDEGPAMQAVLTALRKGREMSAGRRIVDWSVSTWPVASNHLAKDWHIACSTDTGFLYVKYAEDGQS